MAHVIGFPLGQKLAADVTRPVVTEPGVVIILPVVRIERMPDEPDGIENGTATKSRRRRRARS